MFTRKSRLLKGVLSGIILSCINLIFIIISLYDINFDFICYGILIVSAIISAYFLINEKILKTIYSFFISILSFVITELIIGLTGIVPVFFKLILGASYEMWAGDGFGMVVILQFSFVGYILGTILAIILSIIKCRKEKNT